MGSALAGSECRHGDELPRNGPSSALLPSAYAKSSSLLLLLSTSDDICSQHMTSSATTTIVFVIVRAYSSPQGRGEPRNLDNCAAVSHGILQTGPRNLTEFSTENWALVMVVVVL